MDGPGRPLPMPAPQGKPTDRLASALPRTGEKTDDPRAAYVFDETMRTHGVDPTLAIPADKLRFIQDLSVSSGVQPQLVDLDRAVDGSLRDKALKLVEP
jgi:hypothetical protein